MNYVNNGFCCKSPVLFLIFNRPELTAQVFETIRKARPPRLYVAADGPRTDREGEAQRVDQARRIATGVDWDCEVKTLFREQNLGCGKAVSEGITWFFEQEEEGIILEDDVLVDNSWFRFCDELLERYRHDEEIMCVCAHGHDYPIINDSSYAFSHYTLIWGWASWRRAWKHYDYKMSEWDKLSKTDWLKKIGNGSLAFEHFWKSFINEVYSGKCDTWDVQWAFSAWKNNGLCIHPNVNVIENIGFGPDATHTTKESEKHLFNMNIDSIQFPLVHPSDRIVCTKRENFISKSTYKIKRTYFLRLAINYFTPLRYIKNLLKTYISILKSKF
jgi:hypothetical protein